MNAHITENNNFAQRVPVLEEQVKEANHRILNLEEHEHERKRS